MNPILIKFAYDMTENALASTCKKCGRKQVGAGNLFNMPYKCKCTGDKR